MFEIKIKSSGTLKSSELDDSVVDYETTESMIMSLCSLLDDLECCSFNVSGFGDDSWPVDVCTDMSVILEQINPALKAVFKSQDFELNFYEQGIERLISFSFDSGRYCLSCTSGTDWLPSPEQDIDIDTIKDQLVKFKSSFIAIALEAVPSLKSQLLFEKWETLEA